MRLITVRYTIKKLELIFEPQFFKPKSVIMACGISEF